MEVADTTIKSDRNIKIPLYAGSEITEVWLVYVNEQVIEIFREPTNNSYQNIQKLQTGEIFVQAFPNISFAVEQIVG